MTFFRHRLRLLAAAWLLIQAASVAALVPRDCCAAHRPAVRNDVSCHEHGLAEEKPAAECTLRGTCPGPMAALFAQLSNHGVLPDSFAILPDSRVSLATVRTPENLIRRLAPPDPPPPRA